MELVAKRTVVRIEFWHGLFLLAILGTLAPAHLVEPKALLFGGLFMGLNFLLLSLGVARLLTPLAGQRRIKTGIVLLVLKILLFLGVLTTLFFRFDFDAISFALGFSTLLVAILVEAVRGGVRLGT